VTTEVIYGSVTLSNPSPRTPVADIRAKRRPLLDGTQQVFDAPSYGERWRFSCLTTEWSEVTALRALIGVGTYGTTLYIDSALMGWCTIVSLAPREVEGTGGTLIGYTVEFARSTSGVSS
jgi:hypothetical protein